jgi:hypothetical protein
MLLNWQMQMYGLGVLSPTWMQNSGHLCFLLSFGGYGMLGMLRSSEASHHQAVVLSLEFVMI